MQGFVTGIHNEMRYSKSNTGKEIVEEKIYIVSKPGFSVIFPTSPESKRKPARILRNLAQKITKSVDVQFSNDLDKLELIKIIDKVMSAEKELFDSRAGDKTDHIIEKVYSAVAKSGFKNSFKFIDVEDLIANHDIFFVDVVYSETANIAIGRYKKINRLTFPDRKFKFFVLSVYRDPDIDKIVKEFYESEINGIVSSSLSYSLFLRNVIQLYESKVIINEKDRNHIELVYEFLEHVISNKL